MKTNKEHLVDAYLLLIIQSALTLLTQVVNMPTLAFAGLVLEIVAINKLIRYAQDQSDFKMARFALVATFLALLFSVMYTMQIVSTYVDMNIDPMIIIAENKGLLVAGIISTTLSQGIIYFLTQGSVGVCKNEIEDSALATIFDKLKLFPVAFIVLNIVSLFVPGIVLVLQIGVIVFMVLLLIHYWKLRQALIVSINA